jgi:nicotinic acid phosphoribosyltransferase
MSKKINPFSDGISYEDFVKALGTQKIKEYLKEFELSEDDLNWLESEIENYKNNLKTE